MISPSPNACRHKKRSLTYTLTLSHPAITKNSNAKISIHFVQFAIIFTFQHRSSTKIFKLICFYWFHFFYFHHNLFVFVSVKVNKGSCCVNMRSYKFSVSVLTVWIREIISIHPDIDVSSVTSMYCLVLTETEMSNI